MTDGAAERPLGLLTRVIGETAAFARLEPKQQERWWSTELPKAFRSLERNGGRTVGIWRTSWTSDYHYVIAHEFRDVAALEDASGVLREAGFYRYLRTSRILGRRWGGEPGWAPEKFRVREDRRPPLGGVLIYRIMDALESLTRLQYQQRSFERIAILERAVNELIARGGQRLGAYLCEWSSEFHLYVLYEFPDLPALETFNASLPERNGFFPERNMYMDYDILWTFGRLTPPGEIVRP